MRHPFGEEAPLGIFLIVAVLFGAYAMFFRWIWRNDHLPQREPIPPGAAVPPTQERVLFVCTHNSARSQMAEGYLRGLGGDRFAVASAGTEARGVNPLAVRAMAADGIDISLHEWKTIDRFIDVPFDLVVTVCDEAAEACPYMPNARRRAHWSFPDPSAAVGTDAERYAVFLEVRDAIRERIERELLRVPAA